MLCQVRSRSKGTKVIFSSRSGQKLDREWPEGSRHSSVGASFEASRWPGSRDGAYDGANWNREQARGADRKVLMTLQCPQSLTWKEASKRLVGKWAHPNTFEVVDPFDRCEREEHAGGFG